MSFPKKLTKDQITNEHSKNLIPFLQKIKNKPCTRDNWNWPVYRFLQDSDITVNPEGSEICNFLKGKCIFITGGTGFLGRTLVEKLLRACIDIDTLYLLIREKKGKDKDTRLDDMLDCILFSNLSEMYPNFKRKIVPIYGDICYPDMKLSITDRKTLTERVNIIYHVAATTRFDEKLRTAVAINIKGTQEIVKLGKECQHLESLVYVGTAYSNCDKDQIEEKIYEPFIKFEELITMVDTFTDDQLDNLTPSILKTAPNTYTLTKQISEQIIKNEAKDLPVSIFRPSVVITTYREPLKGWTDNLFGAVGIMVGVATGLIRVMPLNENSVIDFVPVDYVINACIACSYETFKRKDLKELTVYNYTSYNDNPMTWKYLFDGVLNRYKRYIGSVNVLWYPFLICVTSEWAYSVLNFLYHKVPGYIVDAIMNLLGKPEKIDGMPARLGYVYKKIDKFVEALKFFTLREFHFDNANVRKLWDSLNPQDKKNFNFDLKQLDWEEHFVNMGVGGRMYVVNEPLDNLEESRRYLTKLYYIHTGLKYLLFSLLAYLIYKMVWYIF